ncbi:MAG: dTDP-4-dehydrorhamnose 3,5-epimerase [Solirubrobacteraceae bacterium]|jgi:dTDP-4-dehydrorhamnose 3,5-epimerase|nr:dTDP-4-dehydrorhamnose 3,5-epimerase [Solirubrobacteraceae bacterium]
MRRILTGLDGPVLLESDIHGDERGFFLETFRASELAELGIADDWVQDNHSRSRRGVVRGMHFQPGMGKLVRCARGTILDVAVDLRRDGGAFGRWEAAELSDANGRALYVPDGFAHGFCVLSDEADVLYRCTDYYRPDREGGFAYDDPDVGIEWPRGLELEASERDRGAPRLAAIADSLPF